MKHPAVAAARTEGTTAIADRQNTMRTGHGNFSVPLRFSGPAQPEPPGGVGPVVASTCFQERNPQATHRRRRMMDPRPHPTADEIRKSLRKVRSPDSRPENRQTIEIADAPTRANERENVRGNDREDLLATIEELRLAEENLRLQSEALAASRDALFEERTRFREMFDFAPDAYLITDLYGTIRDANVAASRLLGVDAKRLVGKALPSFFEESARRRFPHQLDELCDRNRLDNWDFFAEPRRGPKVAVSASVAKSSRN
ncbi:MAG TPA: PAS domain S-box protein [Gemmatimonadaceae bacterium]|nr:PAS domain S-box protein [Gemmatimonadaceae bacterium]